MSKLTESDLELLRDTAARFFDDQLPVDALRRLRDEADDIGFNRVIWREMAEMGWAGILIDERHGGIDPGHIAMGSILEQAGRTLAASPLISTAVISAPIIAHSADSTEHEGVLARMAAGDCILALAHEEGSRHAPHCIATRAEKHGKTYLINGRKTFVLDGHAADHLIV
ncbi:MAG: acyl-CoA dehydrogenase family protein, partial [Gammaproteobacteria bacterium]